MVSSSKITSMAIALGLLLGSSQASAKVYVNSMCKMMANSAGNVIEGDNDKNKKFPLASISKIVTALWAIERFGPDYRYKTRLHFTPAGNDSYNLHIEGSRDPIFGRNASYFLISELNRRGMNLNKIENLTFDENFLFDWLSEESPRIGGNTPYYNTIEKQTAAVKNSLLRNFATALNKTNYNQLKSEAASIGVDLFANPTISIKNVGFVASKLFNKTAETQTLIYQSAPLANILKRMNNQSNNYIADTLYWSLGGTNEFNRFVSHALAASANDIEFYLGSGNNADYLDEIPQTVYNQATCEMMIKILYRLDKILGIRGYKLSQVMAVAGVDTTSTVAGYTGNFADAMTAKTGSVNKAKTLAGSLSTNNGILYFAVLMHTDDRTDWGEASATIRTKVNQLIVENGGAKKMNYKELATLPFDRLSYLISEDVFLKFAN